MLRNGFRIALVNLAVLLALLLLAELAARGIALYRSCQVAACDAGFLTSLRIERHTLQSWNIGISRFDGQLGYVPQEGFDKVISKSGWKRCRVTIDSRGFRSNDNAGDLAGKRILAVGDSFTFGDQVSNDQTWPSCLERKLGVKVDNGGVFGYGAAQALKRAQVITEKGEYDVVVLSLLVGADFVRDQMQYRSGWPSPAVIRDGRSDLAWADVPDPNTRGTKYNPAPNNLAKLAYEHSLILSKLINALNPKTIYGDGLARRHPAAATVPEIIDWTLRNFARLNARQKIVLLQYDRHHGEAPAQYERPLILRGLERYGIQYVDTLGALRSRPKELLWNGHHTPLGNEIVCGILSESLRRDGHVLQTSRLPSFSIR